MGILPMSITGVPPVPADESVGQAPPYNCDRAFGVIPAQTGIESHPGFPGPLPPQG